MRQFVGDVVLPNYAVKEFWMGFFVGKLEDFQRACDAFCHGNQSSTV